MKGTSEEGTERGMGGGREDGRDEASGGGIEPGREGGKLQRRYPEEGTGQYTVFSQTIPQCGPCP